MKFRLLFLALALVWSGGFLNAQVTFFSENIGSGTGTQTIAATTFQNSPGITYTGTADTRVTGVSTGYTGASGGKNVFFTTTAGTNLNISGISTLGYAGITLSLGILKTTNSATNELTIEYSTDGVSYTALSYALPTGTGTSNVWQLVSPTGSIPSTANLRLRFTNSTAGQQFRIDDIQLSGIAGIETAQNGPWTTGATWVGGVVPTSAQSAVVKHAVTDNTGITRNAGTVTLVNTGASLTVSNGYTNNGTTTVDGSFTVDGANGVAINAGSTFRVNGTATIGSGGYFNTNAPIYGNASTLTYSTNGTFGRGFEWTALGVGTIGTTPGYPNNVTLTNNTTLNYNNGTPNAKAMAGNLTINSGSSFYMDFGGGNSGGPLTVAGNVVNNGNFTLGNGNGTDDLRLAGNFTNGPTGIFNGNGRAIFFIKATGTQTVAATAPSTLTIPYVVFDSLSNRTVQLGSDVTISAPNTGTAIAFGSAADILSLNGFTLTIGTAGVANTITGAGTFSGTASSNMTLLGTGSIGNLNFTAGAQNLGTFTLNRTSGALAATLGTPLTINSTLALTNGLLDVGNYPLTFTVAGVWTAGISNYIIAEKSTTTPNAAVRKLFSAGGTGFNWRIGDGFSSPNGSEFSAATTFIGGGTFAAGAYISMAVVDAKEPNFDGANYITRYWEIVTSGISGTPTINGSFYYTDADVVGTEATMLGNSWNGTAWLNNGTLVNTAANQFNVTAYPLGTTRVTAGLRDVDINVRGVIGANPTITSGDVTPSGLDNTLFAAQTIGNTQTKTFRIENVGNGTLTVPSIMLTGVNPGDFSVTASTPYNIAGATGFVDFTITFQPTASGVRTAIVNIASNDPTGSENPYTFMVQGTGDCPTASNTVTPASGPAGTVVTITATAGNLNGASVTFNGVAAVVTQISPTQVTAVVPVGAISGPIITTNSVGCSVSTAFAIIKQVTSGCQGGAALPTNLFISQLTDSGTDGISYVEIFNGTGAGVSLNGWSLRFYNNGSATVNGGTVNLNNVVLANNSTYTVAVGITSPTCTTTTGGNGELANQTSANGGINFQDTSTSNVNIGHDHIRLYNGATHVDSWGVYTDQTWAIPLNLNGKGANFERKNNVIAPNTAYATADWNVTDWGDTCTDLDYTNLNTFDPLNGTPPTITTQPTFTPSCKATSFTVTATEGFAGANPLAYQWFEVAPGATNWTPLSNAGIYSGVTTATLTISNISGLTGYQYYVQVRENTANCYTASHAVMVTGISTVTWNGTAWTPSAPTATTPAVIDGTYNTGTHGSFEACSLTINAARTLTISANTYVSIVNDLTVAATGNLHVQDDGSLVMIEDTGIVTNNGTTQVARTTTPFNKFDYTYWSSPVAGTTLGAAMTGWRLDYSWTFNTANYTDVTGPNGTGPADGFDDNNDTWTFAGAGATMIPAKAYAVMGPTNLGAYPATSNVTFTGAVNNGVINIPLALSANAADPADDYNLVGNPYPSAIFADDLINLNTNFSGTLLFWTHSTPVSNTAPGPYQYNFVTADYAMYNLSGGVASSNGGAQPTGYVASGQGFFVEAITASNLIFNNSMRDKAFNNANFYRNANLATAIAPVQKDRVWLNMQHAIGLFSQQLVCYSEYATLGVDRGYDGVVSNAGNSVSFYSFIDSEKYRIQGRPAFDIYDIVPLGLKTALPGTYTISIEHAEGILNDPSQPVYLEDKLLGVIHNLKEGPYTFDIPLGASDERFQLRYTDTALGNPNPIFSDEVIVVSGRDEINILSKGESISGVEIFDLLGRNIFAKNDIGAHEFSVPVIIQEQAFMVRITLADGQKISKKIVH